MKPIHTPDRDPNGIRRLRLWERCPWDWYESEVSQAAFARELALEFAK
jgi:hypothetical protein